MKTKHFTPIIALAALSVAFSVQAHDPKEHMKDAENPNCAAIKNMDHSKMDMNDPVMQAMMQQCMKDMHKDNQSSENANQEDGGQEEHTANDESLEHKH
tara:strand:+ start:340 stop:636 length:297 start_codon:yes stop_codon:yes gene_type:complete